MHPPVRLVPVRLTPILVFNLAWFVNQTMPRPKRTLLFLSPLAILMPHPSARSTRRGSGRVGSSLLPLLRPSLNKVMPSELRSTPRRRASGRTRGLHISTYRDPLTPPTLAQNTPPQPNLISKLNTLPKIKTLPTLLPTLRQQTASPLLYKPRKLGLQL